MKTTEQLPERIKALVKGSIALMLALLAVSIPLLALDEGAWILQDLAYFGTMGLAAVLCLARVLLVNHQRTVWMFVTAVLFGNLLAESLYYFLELPVPSIADVVWLLCYPLMLGALIALIAPMVQDNRRLLLLDWLIATLALSALAVMLFLPSVFEAHPGFSLESVVPVIYPVADIILIAALLVVLFTGARRRGAAISLIALAGFVWLASDTIFSYQSAVGDPVERSILELGWPLAFSLLGLAAWSPAEMTIDRLALRRRAGMLSGICVLLALSVLTIRELREVQYTATFFLAIAAVAGGGIRLIMAQRENRRLLAAANTDHLTGISSRARLWADAEAFTGSRVTVAVLDLDGFKFYNDSFGHTAGDALLQKIATELVKATETDGEVYRIGGDEFCALLPGDSKSNAEVLEGLRRATRITGKGFEISASLGFADYPAEADDIAGALSLADVRMYEKKSSVRTSARSQVHEALVRSLREREPELAFHNSRVRRFAVAVASELVRSSEDLDIIGRAAELHDVGKVAIPDAILSKGKALDQDEWDLMKQHTEVGERIIGASPALKPVATLVRHSHEHWDGTGYPDGLLGTDIPLGSRIILACDALDAMMSNRPYSPPSTAREALTELEGYAGKQFDPSVVAILRRLIDSGELTVEREPVAFSTPELDK